MENYEALPEDDPEPDDVVLKNIGEVAMTFGEFERDTFLDGLRGQPPDWYWDQTGEDKR